MRLAVLRRDQEQEPPLVRDGSLRQSRQAEAFRPSARAMRRGSRCVAASAGARSCARELETDQARLCRMALPALSPRDATVTILGQREDADGRGVAVDFTRWPQAARRIRAECRFRAPGRPLRSDDSSSSTSTASRSGDTQPLFPHPLLARDARGARRRSRAARRHRRAAAAVAAAAYALQQAINGLPLDGGLCAAGGRLFAGLRPGRPHQSRLRRAGGGGRLWRGVRRGADGSARRRPICSPSPACSASRSRRAGASPRAAGCSAAAARHRPDRAGRDDRACCFS